MTQPNRDQRLNEDLQLLRELEDASSIFSVAADGQPPSRFRITFRGPGLRPDPSLETDCEMTDKHELEIRIPYAYPERPPEVRWTSPVFHPNVSPAGYVDLTEIGLHWNADMPLAAVCERLWDVARLAFVHLEDATNYSAATWMKEDCQREFPLDERPLRNQPAAANPNVVKYRRRGKTAELTATEPVVEEDVLFIGEDTPVPDEARPRRNPNQNDDVFYIGE